MDKRVHALFQPIRIGTCEVKNRILMCPMDPGPIVNLAREFDYRTKNILEERAKRGVGLIISGSIYVLNPDGSCFADYRDAFLGPATEMCGNIHQYGAKVFGQLTIGVGRCQRLTPENVDSFDKNQLVAPSSGIPNAWMPEVKHQGVSKEWINNLLQCFRDSARLIKDAGFDGIEVHALHEGYLLDQFAISNFNHRTDEYGGPLENRLRLAKDLLRAVKDSCGEGFPVTMRMSIESKMKGIGKGALPGETYSEYGRDRNEAIEVAKLLEKMGYDAIDADNGSNEAWYWSHPPVYIKHLCNLEDVAFVKPYVRIPVYCSGKMDDPIQVAKAVEEGRIDGAGVGRALLADAGWVDKVMNGHVEDIRPCIACNNGCFRIIFGQSMVCAVNPRLGMADEEDYGRSAKPGKIAIIGGGIGGMEAARVCRKRGHRVELYEQASRLGGVFVTAAVPECKSADRELIQWYIREMDKNHVSVHLNTRIAPDTLKNSNFDHIIVATGSKERKIPLPTDPNADVRTAVEALSHLDSVKDAAVVIGGGLTGCEIAYELARKNRKVSVVEMLPDILQVKYLSPPNSMMLRDLLNYYHVDIYTNARVTAIKNEEAVVNSPEGEKTISAGTVIIAAGYVPENTLYQELSKAGIKAFNVGDSKEVGNVLSVIEDAYATAMSI